MEKDSTGLTKMRVTLSSIVFGAGFLSPLLIPLILASNMNSSIKTALSGLLAFGIPELAMLAAAAIAGKEGFALIKNKIFLALRVISSDQVSKRRYITGLIMFTFPLIFGTLFVYIQPLFDRVSPNRVVYSIILDSLFILSIFVLGGNFWDKLRSLFIYNATVRFKDEEG